MPRRAFNFGYTSDSASARRPGRVTVYDVSDQKAALKKLAQITREASVHPDIVHAARALTNDCPGRDDTCELEAIFNGVKYGDHRVRGLERGLRYVSDPKYADYFSSPSRLIRECALGACSSDCLPSDTKVLAAGYKLVDIGSVQPGDTIMGDGEWVRVTNSWDKGIQPMLAFELNNGCVLRCTPDHRVYRVPKVHRKSGGGGAYAGDRNAAEEVRAGDLSVGDDLLTPNSFPFGREDLGVDKAWLLGVHVADGWCGYNDQGQPRNVGISGKDGFPKEAQKRRVEEICSRLGVSTRWNERYISISDKDIAEWLGACGRGAKNKHVPSLDFAESTVRPLIEGLAADACLRDDCAVFGTISETLALQLRVLHRMLGQSVHIRRVDKHGGLGKNPIYRVTVRRPDDPRRPHARIRAIIEQDPEPSVDIEVEGHRFYLPETDLVVHNCDEHAALVCALAGAVGFETALRAWGRDPNEFVHVYAMVAIPKKSPENMVGLDTTVADSYIGWQPSPGYGFDEWVT